VIETRYGYRAFVQPDLFVRGVSIYLGHATDGRITRIAVPTKLEWVDVDPDQTPPDRVDPWLRLPDNAATPLLDALAGHYGGHTDLRTLRRDYEAERARVDKLIDRLSSPALVR